VGDFVIPELPEYRSFCPLTHNSASGRKTARCVPVNIELGLPAPGSLRGIIPSTWMLKLTALRINLKICYNPITGPLQPPLPLKPHVDRVSPLQRGVHRELKQVRALAVAFAELFLSVALSVHLPRAPAGPEILVQNDGAPASMILSHSRSHPEMTSVIRALEGAPTTVQVSTMRCHTSLRVPWPKIRRGSP